MNRTEVIKELRKAMEFYQGLGFEHMPVKLAERHILEDSSSLSRVAEPVSDYSVDKTEALRKLRAEIGDCARCRLSKGRTNIVFGEGDPDADLMFIGEGPGREEDRQAKPFVGDAGKVLTSLINKMGFDRGNVYIANVVKCRPPSNRNPEEDEMDACGPFIEKQIDIIAPKVIVALGKFAAQRLTASRVPISRLRGNFYEYRDIPVMPTFHPAYLMRNPKDKWLTWEDAQEVLKELNYQHR